MTSIDPIDWTTVAADLNARGHAVLKSLLPAATCDALRALYPDETRFRSRVTMARHGFGRGEYKYFSYPLPPIMQQLRETLYPHFAAVANDWAARLNAEIRFPATHREFLARCRDAGQTRPTPLLLRYGPDDFNCLHQDLYGDHVFPLQAVVLLSEPGCEFTGGELMLTEQRPRMQSRAEVIGLKKGDAAVFAVHHRPHRGTHGVYRVTMRHGVSRVLSGERFTAGVIFHDAA